VLLSDLDFKGLIRKILRNKELARFRIPEMNFGVNARRTIFEIYHAPRIYGRIGWSLTPRISGIGRLGLSYADVDASVSLRREYGETDCANSAQELRYVIGVTALFQIRRSPPQYVC
jgi:single-stranded DNA-specific DHH superfamily exonuclease